MNFVICKVCEGPFKDQYEYNEHSKRHVMSYESLDCMKCGILFENQKKLNNHLWKHLGIFPCKNCDEKFLDVADLEAHEERDHFELEEEKPVIDESLLEMFSDPIQYESENIYSHSYSHAKFSYIREFKRSVKWMETNSKFTCDICQKSFSGKSKLKVHIDIHLNPDLFSCENCGKRFTTASHLRNHKILEKNPDTFKCKICPKKFMHLSHLRDHEELHTNPHAFKCKECFRTFTRKDFLTAHLKLHKNPDLYKCNICLTRFSGINYLHTHLLTHSAEDKKVLECRYCNKLLCSKNNLKTHESKCKDKITET